MHENRSLRLCEILAEEYSYLHQSATSADGIELVRRHFRFIQSV